MRVVFTGQTGTEKSGVIQRLREHSLRKLGLSAGCDSEAAKRLIASYSIEQTITPERDYFIKYLGYDSEAFQRDKWSQAMRHILDGIEAQKPEHCFLQMHSVYYRKGWYFNLIDPDLIREFHPDLFISLIDDSFNMWKRVVVRDQNRHDMSYLRLRDIYVWRSVEVMMTDLLAREMVSRKTGEGAVIRPERPSSYIVAVKHPVGMLHNLLFESETRLTVYFSVPITNIRNEKGNVTEVNDAIARLGEKFTLFSPLAIDERILLNFLARDGRESSGTLCVQAGDRWPLVPGETYLQADVLPEDYPIVLDRAEVAEIATEIDQQIRRRDYRLIDDCDCVIVYRPNWGGRLSRGVTAEVLYASQHSGKVIPIHAFSPVSDTEAARESPFDPDQAIVHQSLDSLIDGVSKIKKKL